MPRAVRPDQLPRSQSRAWTALPAALALVMVDQASARTRLLDAYARWAPGPHVEITGTLVR